MLQGWAGRTRNQVPGKGKRRQGAPVPEGAAASRVRWSRLVTGQGAGLPFLRGLGRCERAGAQELREEGADDPGTGAGGPAERLGPGHCSHGPCHAASGRQAHRQTPGPRREGQSEREAPVSGSGAAPGAGGCCRGSNSLPVSAPTGGGARCCSPGSAPPAQSPAGHRGVAAAHRPGPHPRPRGLLGSQASVDTEGPPAEDRDACCVQL